MLTYLSTFKGEVDTRVNFLTGTSPHMSNKTFAALEARLAGTPEFTAESVAVAFMVDINARMLAQGISNVELAQRMGTTRSYITRLFRGSANLSVQTMTRLAAAVGCSVRVQVENPPEIRPLA